MAPRARRRGPAVPRGLLLTFGPEIVFKLGGGVSAVCSIQTKRCSFVVKDMNMKRN